MRAYGCVDTDEDRRGRQKEKRREQERKHAVVASVVHFFTEYRQTQLRRLTGCIMAVYRDRLCHDTHRHQSCSAQQLAPLTPPLEGADWFIYLCGPRCISASTTLATCTCAAIGSLTGIDGEGWSADNGPSHCTYRFLKFQSCGLGPKPFGCRFRQHKRAWFGSKWRSLTRSFTFNFSQNINPDILVESVFCSLHLFLFVDFLTCHAVSPCRRDTRLWGAEGRDRQR